MTKKRWAPEPEGEQAPGVVTEEEKAGESMGFSLSGLFTVDLQRQTVRFATALSLTVANQPDNRIDFDLSAGTVKIPPGWRVINF